MTIQEKVHNLETSEARCKVPICRFLERQETLKVTLSKMIGFYHVFKASWVWQGRIDLSTSPKYIQSAVGFLGISFVG